MMKAVHIRKVRDRAERFKTILGITPDVDHELWAGRMAEVIAGIRGRDHSDVDNIKSKRGRKNYRRQVADEMWRVIAIDLPEMCDALLEAQQSAQLLCRDVNRLQAVLRQAGLDPNGNLLPEKEEQIAAIQRSLLLPVTPAPESVIPEDNFQIHFVGSPEWEKMARG
jgi:hypothetical protein